MRYTEIIIRLQQIGAQLGKPGLSLTMEKHLKDQAVRLTEEIRAYACGDIFKIKVRDPRVGQIGWIFLCNLELSEIEGFTQDILRMEFLEYEKIPIGKLINLS